MMSKNLIDKLEPTLTEAAGKAGGTVAGIPGEIGAEAATKILLDGIRYYLTNVNE